MVAAAFSQFTDEPTPGINTLEVKISNELLMICKPAVV
jgi:hypothetical protein